MTNTNQIIRYYRGSTAARRGGWFVKSIILVDGVEKDGAFKSCDIPTKKEADRLCAMMNEQLEGKVKVKSISGQPNKDGFYTVVLVYNGNTVVIYRRKNDLPRMGQHNLSEVN